MNYKYEINENDSIAKKPSEIGWYLCKVQKNAIIKKEDGYKIATYELKLLYWEQNMWVEHPKSYKFIEENKVLKWEKVSEDFNIFEETIKINLKTNSSKETKLKENVTFILHSIAKNNFEIVDITFHNKREKKLTKHIENLQKQNLKINENIYQELLNIESFQEMVAEDIGDYGDISKKIHKELWNENNDEYYYIVDITISYNTTKDYFTNEIDIIPNYEYKVIGKTKYYEDVI